MNRPEHTERSRRRVTRILRVVLAVIGLSITTSPILIDLIDAWWAGGDVHVELGSHTAVTVAVGVAYLILSAVLQKLPFAVSQASLFLIFIPIFVGFVECAGRISGYDFAQTRARWMETPIYYRQPTEPVGEVFFHRPGPASWTGRVLTTELRRLGAKEWDAYANEEEITVTYDEEGFRNPSALVDWEIVVLGDSFTELGYLPYSDLFSSKLADKLKCRVKNLGVSYTGTLNQCCLLREYGIADSTKDAILVFFEGNDCRDTHREYRSLQRYRETGERELRNLVGHKKTSFVRAVAGILQRTERTTDRVVTNAVFGSGDNRVDLTVSDAPPNKTDLSNEEIIAVESALNDYAGIAESQHVRPWLVYMPCKRRVLHNHLQFSNEAKKSLVEWTPSDMPRWIEGVCEQNGIRFLDLTPHFVERADSGLLLFNHVYDTHLNRIGSSLVADVLSKAFFRQSSEPSSESEKND